MKSTGMNHKNIKLNSMLFLAILFFALEGCNQAIQNANKEFMPNAQGSMGEIILVMDSTQWKSQIGSELRQIFHAVVPGLPQDESGFKLHRVNPLNLNDVLKQAKNLIFVTVLSDKSQESQVLKSYFTNESLKRIQNDDNLYMFTKKDDFAQGQEVLHLFGKDRQTLIANLQENRDKIRRYFENIEIKRLEASLFQSEMKDLRSELKSKHDFSIRVPYGYELARNGDNFVWIRQLEYPEEKSFFVYYEPYKSPDIFNKDSIAKLRDKITSKLLRDVENQDTYMMLQEEKYMPYVTNEISLNGNYAFEMRGLWKLNDISAGGPFVSYTTVDEKLQRLYYIEGYVYRPSNDKRDWMREMDTILRTFEISDQSPPEPTD